MRDMGINFPLSLTGHIPFDFVPVETWWLGLWKAWPHPLTVNWPCPSRGQEVNTSSSAILTRWEVSGLPPSLSLLPTIPDEVALSTASLGILLHSVYSSSSPLWGYPTDPAWHLFLGLPLNTSWPPDTEPFAISPPSPVLSVVTLSWKMLSYSRTWIS